MRSSVTTLEEALQSKDFECAFSYCHTHPMTLTDWQRAVALAARSNFETFLVYVITTKKLANIEFSVDLDGQLKTPLHLACENQHEIAALVLLKAGAKPKAEHLELLAPFSPLHKKLKAHLHRQQARSWFIWLSQRRQAVTEYARSWLVFLTTAPSTPPARKTRTLAAAPAVSTIADTAIRSEEKDEGQSAPAATPRKRKPSKKQGRKQRPQRTIHSATTTTEDKLEIVSAPTTVAPTGEQPQPIQSTGRQVLQGIITQLEQRTTEPDTNPDSELELSAAPAATTTPRSSLRADAPTFIPNELRPLLSLNREIIHLEQSLLVFQQTSITDPATLKDVHALASALRDAKALLAEKLSHHLPDATIRTLHKDLRAMRRAWFVALIAYLQQLDDSALKSPWTQKLCQLIVLSQNDFTSFNTSLTHFLKTFTERYPEALAYRTGTDVMFAIFSLLCRDPEHLERSIPIFDEDYGLVSTEAFHDPSLDSDTQTAMGEKFEIVIRAGADFRNFKINHVYDPEQPPLDLVIRESFALPDATVTLARAAFDLSTQRVLIEPLTLCATFYIVSGVPHVSLCELPLQQNFESLSIPQKANKLALLIRTVIKYLPLLDLHHFQIAPAIFVTLRDFYKKLQTAEAAPWITLGFKRVEQQYGNPHSPRLHSYQELFIILHKFASGIPLDIILPDMLQQRQKIRMSPSITIWSATPASATAATSQTMTLSARR